MNGGMPLGGVIGEGIMPEGGGTGGGGIPWCIPGPGGGGGEPFQAPLQVV